MRHEAIFALYPNAISVVDGIGAFDIDDVLIEIDEIAVATKTAELQVIANAEEKAVVDARQSALNKLMVLGLTEKEALALGIK